MSEQASTRKPLTKAALVGRITAVSRVPEQQVAAVLDALAVQIKHSLGTTGTITILGLVKIEKKIVPTCPTWPPYLKVTVLPQLLPGFDDNCRRGLHTYHESPATNDRGQPVCGACGNDKIDWDRLHKRSIADVTYTIAQLRTDRFRRKWWSKNLDAAAVRHALRKGPAGIEAAVRKRVLDSVGRVYRMEDGTVQPFRDGAQTPFHGNVVYYAQHATAACCRKCIEVWHGIPRGRALTADETDYVSALLLRYVRFELPELGEE